MKKRCHPLWIVGAITLYCLAPTSPTKAQIVPDGTLPINSIVSPQGNTTYITGGTVAGSNLFHSFEQFSIPTGSTAFFNNAEAIQNIISRVTGGSVSNIDGLLRANGTANLFLLNPNGIIFGPNASLNIGGSFLASTASSLNFASGTQFSATIPQATPLLTVSVPIGLQFGGTAGRILVLGPGHNLSVDPTTFAFVRGENPVGLAVQPGKTLALVGGDVTLKGGNLIAEGGRIEVASVAGPSLVSLTRTNFGLTLGYEGVSNFRDIQLSLRASVDASGSSSGEIQVQGKHVTLEDGSAIFGFTLGAKPGGTVAVNASDSIEVIGESADGLFPSAVFTDTISAGAAGDLTINTRALQVLDGAGITADSFGTGNAGNLTVNALDSVQLIGLSANGQFASGLFTTGNAGGAGNLTINTRALQVLDGAQISNSTSGGGDAGSLTVNASDSVELSGTRADSPNVSGLFAETLGAGAGGNLTINTRTLLVQDGGFVSTSTFGSGKAGNLTVTALDEIKLLGESPNGFGSGLFTSVELLESEGGTGAGGNLILKTQRLSVQDGAEISASTSGEGPAGSLQVNANSSVELRGTSTDGQRPSLLTAETTSAGDAGNLTIETGRLTVQDGALVTVSSEGSGNAGNLKATARSIRLDNQGKLTSQSASGQGGNITLQVQDLLLLRNQSQISTSADTANVGADVAGGNINISSNFIVAAPDENSDITANTFKGRGGNIRIAASAIFGIQRRERQTQQSDITASSQLGINGTVQLNTPEVDPSRGIVTLSIQPVNVSGLVATGCPATVGPLASKFVVTGNGGLPPTPREAVSSEQPLVDLGAPIQDQENRASTATPTDLGTPIQGQLNRQRPAIPSHPTSTESAPIVPASGWVFNDKGEVTLTALAPNATPYGFGSNRVPCGVSHK